MVLPKAARQDKREMPRFLIEVSHDSDHHGCVRALQALLSIGSQYVTRADWGCRHGVHRGWLIVEVDSRNLAECIVPPSLRMDSRVVEVNKFSLQEIQDMVRKLSDEQPG